MSQPFIEYCVANVDGEARSLLSSLERTREKPCLQRCGECDEGSIIVADGDLETGAAHSDLVRRVRE